MARRIGSERFTLVRSRPPAFNEPAQEVVIDEYAGCWPEYSSTSQGESGNDMVLSSLVSFWVPRQVAEVGAEDFFTWDRHPSHRYDVDGDIEYLYTRRGQLRACVVPVRRSR